MKGSKKNGRIFKTHYFSNSLFSRPEKKKSLKKELHAMSMLQAIKCKWQNEVVEKH